MGQRDHDADSTLWRVSTLEKLRHGDMPTTEGGLGATLLASTLLADLRRLQADPHEDDPLAAVAACVRHRQSVLLHFAHGDWIWSVTVFPEQLLYHAAHDVGEIAALAALSKVKLVAASPPTVRVPSALQRADPALMLRFRPLAALLGALALHGPRSTLLADIGGRAAYRLTPGQHDMLPETPGALAPAVLRLRRETVSLRDIAAWPGMSIERASRLLNALYLAGGLLVTRAHPAARSEPVAGRGVHGRRP